jgi:hypothetical protein
MSPTASPSVEEAVAIVAAIEAVWPRPTAEPPPPEPPSRWRFSGRWWAKPVPVRRERP